MFHHRGQGLQGITRRLDSQFTKGGNGPCNRKFRGKALALGIKVDRQLTLYAKKKPVQLCLQARVLNRLYDFKNIF